MTASQLRSQSDESRGRLNESRARLFGFIKGLSEEQFRHVPAGETWNIAAHLAHLLRVERLFAARATAALHEDEPYIESTRVLNDDDPALAQHLAVPQIIHGMQAARRELERTLDGGDGGDAALERALRHERFGRMTVRDIMVKMAQHEHEHGEDVERLAKLAPAPRVTIPLTPRS